jgi:hypothetical protein
MMGIEEATVAHLRWYDAEVGPLVGQKIYPSVVPEETATPAIAYELTGQEHGMSHSGPTGLVVSTIALHCLSHGSENYAAAKATAEAVSDAVQYPAQMWGDVPVARVHPVVSGGVWSVETQDWIVTVTVTVNHRG